MKGMRHVNCSILFVPFSAKARPFFSDNGCAFKQLFVDLYKIFQRPRPYRLDLGLNRRTISKFQDFCCRNDKHVICSHFLRRLPGCLLCVNCKFCRLAVKYTAVNGGKYRCTAGVRGHSNHSWICSHYSYANDIRCVSWFILKHLDALM